MSSAYEALHYTGIIYVRLRWQLPGMRIAGSTQSEDRPKPRERPQVEVLLPELKEAETWLMVS